MKKETGSYIGVHIKESENDRWRFFSDGSDVSNENGHVNVKTIDNPYSNTDTRFEGVRGSVNSVLIEIKGMEVNSLFIGMHVVRKCKNLIIVTDHLNVIILGHVSNDLNDISENLWIYGDVNNIRCHSYGSFNTIRVPPSPSLVDVLCSNRLKVVDLEHIMNGAGDGKMELTMFDNDSI